jgi:ABC-2 type transport system permease protein
MSGLSKHLEFLDYITPFKYYEASALQMDRSFEPISIIITIAIVLVSMIGTFIVYPKRDLNI